MRRRLRRRWLGNREEVVPWWWPIAATPVSKVGFAAYTPSLRPLSLHQFLSDSFPILVVRPRRLLQQTDGQPPSSLLSHLASAFPART
ncbi:unnamed protein product [Linum trigynum]